MIGSDQGGTESLRSEPFIKKEDIPVIVDTLASGTADKETGNDALDVSTVFGKEWSLLLLIAIDLEVDVKEIKEIKGGLEAGSVTDAEGLSQILSSWIDKRGNEATWDILISVFSSNIKNYQQGGITKDYVGLLRQLNPDNSDDHLELLVVKAFQIDLIRDAILKRISFEDKRCLRLICRRVHDAMLRDWREKLASLQITANKADQFETFFGHFVEAEDGKFKKGSGAFEIPYLGYHLYDIGSLNLYQPISRPIWINYGANMKQLSFSSFPIVLDMKISEMLKWLLLIACPNLESLRFLSYDYYFEVETEPEMGKQYPVGAIAEKLKTLELQVRPDFSSLFPEGYRQIIEIIPNIESLSINGLDILEDLLLAGQSEAVKLHTLNADLEWCGGSFDVLQRFTSRYPANLKDLSLYDIDLSSGAIRDFPNLLYSFYLGIGQCTSLASLVLDFSSYNDNWDWSTFLSTMEFPLLKTFKIFLVAAHQHEMKFDFTALKGMPQLKSLSVTTRRQDKPYRRHRHRGSADYIYEGPLTSFIPPGKNPFKEHPQDSPIYLEHLEKFEFNLWGLESSDSYLLPQWFPNLRILQANICIEETFVLAKFPKLERWKSLLN